MNLLHLPKGAYLLGLVLLQTACQQANTPAMESVQLALADIPTRSVVDTLAQDTTPEVPPPPTPDTITIAGVGDIMMGTSYPDATTLPPNDGKDMLSDVLAYLQSPDLTFGNVEGVLLNKGGTPKQCNDMRYCYTFRSPEHYATLWKDAGFDLMSVANNHASDFGDGGRASTAKALEKAGLQFAGSVENPTTTFTHNGIKYGFCAFAPNRGCVNMTDYKQAARTVEALDKTCDIVIVSFHAGAEGLAHRHTPCKDEIYLGANRGNVCHFAHTCIDAGADVIFGHGPHVTRAVELYKNRFIAYSLGNFCTYEKFGITGALGHAPIMTIQVNKTGEFLGGRIVPTRQIGKGIPKIDTQNLVIKEIIQLTKADFPRTPLDILEDGTMLKK